MDRLDQTEYRVLRETIARRGTLRPVVMLTGLIAWATLLVIVLVWLPYPLAAVIPLLLLLATFESIRPLHFGSERLGRYLQVFYEEAGATPPLAKTPSWERVAMVFGPGVPGAGGHPLFIPVFGLATLVNYIAVILPGPVAVELGAMAVPHAAFLAWLVIQHRAVRRQRAVEVERFRALRS